ncbi:hypothetical protein L3V83_14215 [Thiotrichales bacterium 19X7-9]|nr:hypothetical protein [Thiotrichales bacterium 19X7-9]
MKPIILLGAGFNADVKSEVSIEDTGVDENYKDYPLLNKMAKICNYDENDNIEEQLYKDIRQNNLEPLTNFCDAIMGCDYYLAQKLRDDSNNCYYRFFDEFKGYQFLTFNYDSLPEIILLELAYWHPKDGYGIPVQYNYDAVLKRIGNIPQHSSQSKVLHLHGTFCVGSDYITTADKTGNIRLEDQKPHFIFDTSSISNAFPSFIRIPSYSQIERRIIPPIPNKAAKLKQEFIQSIYKISNEYIRNSGQLITIGYSFNDHDVDSYRPLLTSLNDCANPLMLIVSPDAHDICARLRQKDFTKNIDIRIVDKTFREWVNSDYEGLDENRN